MPDFDTFLRNIMTDLRVELTEEFDRNFERKAFFTTPWAPVRRTISRGSLMIRSGALRSSISSEVAGSRLTFASSLPYASLHNSGGTITVTPKMLKFFWAMYYRAAGNIKKTKKGKASKAAKSVAATEEAGYWKRMALMKVGKKLNIPQRQFLGAHPEVDRIVEEVVTYNMEELEREIGDMLRRQGPRQTD